MAIPQQISGSKYAFLGIQFRGRCIESNSVIRPLLQSYYYGPNSACDSQPNSPGRKRSLVTHISKGFQARVVAPMLAALSAHWINDGVWARWIDSPTDPWEQVAIQGLTDAEDGAMPAAGVQEVSAGVATGFVLPPDNAATITVLTVDANGKILTFTAVPTAAGVRYIPGNILLATGVGGVGPGRGGLFQVLTTNAGTGAILTVGLLDGGSDYAAGVQATEAYSYPFPLGDGAVAGERLPLDNNVTIRRYTAVRGKNWKGNLRPAPIAESHSTSDELNAAGQLAWKAMVGSFASVAVATSGMYAPIDDDEDDPLYPLLVSTTESQIVRSPTRIAYAPLVLPGIDPTTGVMNGLIDKALGESKRRKERKTLTF